MSKVKDPVHLSGHLHVTGTSKFIDDEIKPAKMLVAKLCVSTKAHAKINKIEVVAARKLAGVHAVITHADIPGHNQIGHPIPDQPLLAENEVLHVGQPLAIVVAEDAKIAAEASKLITVEYEELPAIFTIPEAIAADSYFAPERKIECGNVADVWQNAEHVIEGEVATGAQEHFYFETQRTWAFPKADKEITLYSSTQGPSDVQTVVAEVLGVQRKDVEVDVKRLGGGFGGKESSSAVCTAAVAAVAASLTKRPVEFKLTRMEDMAWTGKRHPFIGRYKIACDSSGKISGYEAKLYANGGAFADLSLAILERGMLHADNAYYLPNARILGYACKTNLPANTAFRGFGAPQGIFVLECALEKIAAKLQLDPMLVREINLYQEGQQTPYGQPVYEACHRDLFAKVKSNSNYQQLLQETTEFNSANKFIKRGVGVVPVKFGISFTASFLNQGSSLLWIYADGSISLSHGGIEMGQEINTKIAQIVAQELGVGLDAIRVESSNTKRIGNASPTAASSGTDINGCAALNAARKLKERLTVAAIAYFKTNFNHAAVSANIIFANNEVFDNSSQAIKVTFKELAGFAYLQQTDLGAHGFYKTPGLHFDRETGVGNPFYYYVFGVCVAQIEVDVLTGKTQLLKTYIVHEAAKSLNKGIDEGQIAGAFFQGYGWLTMEELLHDKQGNYLAITPSTYKIPAIRDLPEVFSIEMVALERKHASVFGSKAIGEPPFVYGEVGYFAVQHALAAIGAGEVELPAPATPEAIAIEADRLISKRGE